MTHKNFIIKLLEKVVSYDNSSYSNEDDEHNEDDDDRGYDLNKSGIENWIYMVI